jgi:pimeloyl-ACP methyl ester carboxylesterase
VRRIPTKLRNKPLVGFDKASIDDAIEYLRAAEDDRSADAAQLHRVLVIHGTYDKIISLKSGMELAHTARARFVAVPEGHFSVLNNETVHAAIKSFLDGA